MSAVKKVFPLVVTFFCLFSCPFAAAVKVPSIDAELKEDWQKQKLVPARRSSDEVFLRRVWLNAAGRVPDFQEVVAFSADKAPDKRAKLIEKVLSSPEFADMLAMRMSDMFRVKSEFPINLWPNAVQAYHRYLRDAVMNNTRWNVLARDLITSSGSNFREAQINFMRAAANRSPEGLANCAALSFMGVRLERVPEAERAKFANFFSRAAYKSTDEWKEEIVFTGGDAGTVEVGDLSGRHWTIEFPARDPREEFADWLLAPENPYFAGAFVNRTWGWLFGSGIIDPPDDMPVVRSGWRKFADAVTFADVHEPEVRMASTQKALEKIFRKSGYDIKQLFRVIMNSEAYQADWRPASGMDTAKSSKYFASYPVRRMEAEVIIDMLAKITGRYEKYSSVIPEPFTFLPDKYPSVKIADGSITSTTLENFGRPPRDSGKWEERNNRITVSQRQYLMNSGKLYSGLSTFAQRVARAYIRDRKNGDRRRVDYIYMTMLSRRATDKEYQIIKNYRRKLPDRKARKRIWTDLIWSIANGTEFLYYH